MASEQAIEHAITIMDLRDSLKLLRDIIHQSDNYTICGDDDPLTSDLLVVINKALGDK